MRNAYCRNWNMGKKLTKRGKCEMHTAGHGIWREKLKIVENEKCIL
jgi:hypothetical protein